MQILRHSFQLTVAATAFAAGMSAAAPLPTFEQSINFSSPACANYGDFVSCSAQYLNYLTTGSPTGTQTTNYVLQSPQGLLQNALVVFTGGQAAVDNTDIGPNIDNAYRVFDQNITTYGTSVGAGQNLPGPGGLVDPLTPVIGETPGPVSNQTAWDIGLQSLISALTVNGERRDLLIFFDNNQQGVTPSQTILVSGLVCVQDVQGALGDMCFELVDQNGLPNTTNNPDPSLYNTSLVYGSPLGTNPVTANGTFCVSTTTKQVVAFNVQSQNDCPANTVFVNNNLGTNQTEFIVAIPELNSNLEAFLAQGYDLVSTQLLFQNQNGGFEDVFLLAGPAGITQVAEPGTLMLLGLGLVGLFGLQRRRNC
jgi:hypothetical protein